MGESCSTCVCWSCCYNQPTGVRYEYLYTRHNRRHTTVNNDFVFYPEGLQIPGVSVASESYSREALDLGHGNWVFGARHRPFAKRPMACAGSAFKPRRRGWC